MGTQCYEFAVEADRPYLMAVHVEYPYFLLAGNCDPPHPHRYASQPAPAQLPGLKFRVRTQFESEFSLRRIDQCERIEIEVQNGSVSGYDHLP